eukprot:356345-Chlamydomonas_euryale.AAC.2
MLRARQMLIDQELVDSNMQQSCVSPGFNLPGCLARNASGCKHFASSLLGLLWHVLSLQVVTEGSTFYVFAANGSSKAKAAAPATLQFVAYNACPGQRLRPGHVAYEQAQCEQCTSREAPT